ncbi:hypothetical protein KKA14_06605 [bacterium]|nr:hypothetical protein [bacterium]
MKKSLILLIITAFLNTVSISVWAQASLMSIMVKHRLSNGNENTWHVLNIKQRGDDLTRESVKLKWIDTVSAGTDVYEEPIKPDEYLKHEAVKSLLLKNEQIFNNIIKLSQTHEKIVNRGKSGDTRHIKNKSRVPRLPGTFYRLIKFDFMCYNE